MKKIIFLIIIYLSSYACDGDCIKCHPVLLKNGTLDKNHKVLSNCITCHKISSDDLIKMGSLCGQDCWECHSVKKVIKIKNKEHLSLSYCIECHKKLKEEEQIVKINNFSNISDVFKQRK